jgi:hypothetical protein
MRKTPVGLSRWAEASWVRRVRTRRDRLSGSIAAKMWGRVQVQAEGRCRKGEERTRERGRAKVSRTTEQATRSRRDRLCISGGRPRRC